MTDSTPVRLFEDGENGGRFLIYGSDSGVKIEVRYEGDNLWLTQAQVATLFGVTVATISHHIGSIYEEGELSPEATLLKIDIVRTEGERQVSVQSRRDSLC
jgi:hypothetical protein